MKQVFTGGKNVLKSTSSFQEKLSSARSNQGGKTIFAAIQFAKSTAQNLKNYDII